MLSVPLKHLSSKNWKIGTTPVEHFGETGVRKLNSITRDETAVQNSNYFMFRRWYHNRRKRSVDCILEGSNSILRSPSYYVKDTGGDLHSGERSAEACKAIQQSKREEKRRINLKFESLRLHHIFKTLATSQRIIYGAHSHTSSKKRLWEKISREWSDREETNVHCNL